MEIWAAIDLSGKEACFSAGAYPERRQMICESFAMKGRDSSSLLPKIEELLRTNSLSVNDISRWTAGTGPGNYTGLRIVSSLVSGIVFGRDSVFCRGIPSANAILSDMATSENENAAVVYPFEPGKVFVFCGTRRNGSIFRNMEVGGVFSTEEFLEKLSGMKYAVLERDLPVLSERVAENAVKVSVFPVQNLVFACPGSWERNSVRDLIYMRPAVNVAPMQIRTEL
ncbi:MAG TPA: hypothetical protein DET40_19525 [Lentisphaeria bacterium]|nr:MAG: hypothetical protein A2X45_18355 [Lentisphaerae bacterium GWF2_50_93]HCE45739.1 hypothetical protein [Lentisphaeria bacterium]